MKSIERSSPLVYTKCTNIFQATFCSMHHSLDSTGLDKNKEEGMFGILKRSEDSVPDAEPVSDSSAASCDHDPSHRHEFLPQNVPLEVGGEEFREHPLVASKQVSFGDLEIRKYAVILGDHPECCMGPPVSSARGKEYLFLSTLGLFPKPLVFASPNRSQ